MTRISDERVKQLKDDIDRARHYKLQHVAMSPDEVDALLAEREAARKVRDGSERLVQLCQSDAAARDLLRDQLEASKAEVEQKKTCLSEVLATCGKQEARIGELEREGEQLRQTLSAAMFNLRHADARCEDLTALIAELTRLLRRGLALAKEQVGSDPADVANWIEETERALAQQEGRG